MHPSPRRLVAVSLMVGAVVAVAGCSDAGGTEESIVFGRGSIPSTFPGDFPVPANAVIGSTLIDRVNHRSEVNMTLRSEMVAAVQFFQVGLVNQGYVVGRSEGDRGSWRIEFGRGELRGEIGFEASADVVQVFVSINAS